MMGHVVTLVGNRTFVVNVSPPSFEQGNCSTSGVRRRKDVLTDREADSMGILLEHRRLLPETRSRLRLVPFGLGSTY